MSELEVNAERVASVQAAHDVDSALQRAAEAREATESQIREARAAIGTLGAAGKEAVSGPSLSQSSSQSSSPGSTAGPSASAGTDGSGDALGTRPNRSELEVPGAEMNLTTSDRSSGVGVEAEVVDMPST